MALRYITGRSGQGKTEYLVKEVIRRSIEIPEKQYYVIVPEQFSLEMQRKIVKMHPRHGFFNIDVLSFHRLSYRIFAECNYQPKEILEDLGVKYTIGIDEAAFYGPKLDIQYRNVYGKEISFISKKA